MKILLCSLMLFLTISCTKMSDNYIKMTGMVNISETIIPDTSIVFEKVQIRGKAEATNGCWKNLYFQFRKINDFEYELKANGTYESTGVCSDVMVYKDTLIDFIPAQKGTYLFYTIKKPYKIITDTMIVR
jgi:hypothetical protein